MDDENRHHLTFYFQRQLHNLSITQLAHYDKLINEHVTDCIEIKGYIKAELESRPDNGHQGPG